MGDSVFIEGVVTGGWVPMPMHIWVVLTGLGGSLKKRHKVGRGHIGEDEVGVERDIGVDMTLFYYMHICMNKENLK